MTFLPQHRSFAIRAARMRDLEDLTAIDALCFPTGIAYPREEVAGLLRNPHIVTVVAEQDGAIAGFAACQWRQEKNVRYGELITLEVLPRFRRQSMGRALYQTLEMDMKESGGTRMQLQVSVENEAAISFYRSVGFHAVDRIPRYYLKTIDAWQMEKLLP